MDRESRAMYVDESIAELIVERMDIDDVIYFIEERASVKELIKISSALEERILKELFEGKDADE